MTSHKWSSVPITWTAIGLFLAASPAAAEQSSVQGQKLQVQARIGDLCTVTSASLDFGSGVDITKNNDAQGSIAITCAVETPLQVELDGGKQPTLQGIRAMSDGQTTLHYDLYKDAARTQLWSVGERVAASISGSGSVAVYGRVPIQTNGHSSGVYTDEVTITLVF